MATIKKKLKENIESLSDIEKIELVDSILMTLDRPDPKIDRIWAEMPENAGRLINPANWKRYLMTR